MKLLETARRQWQARMGEEETPFDGDTPAWVVSLLVHVAVLLSLALTGLAERPEPVRNFTVIEAPPEVEEEVVLESQEFAVSEDPREQIGADSEQGDEAAQAVAPIFAPVSVVSVEVQDDLVSDVTLPPVDDIPTAEVSDAAVVRQGARGVGAPGATGAVDHLTAEIEASLARGPTVVCWVFDRSVSLSAQRNQIADRMSRVFHQLGAMRAAANRPDLENMVVAFGESVGLVTKNPTDDVDEVVKAIRSISVDDSGVEMTFLAIRKTAEVAKKFRQGAGGRNVMIVVFTDEVGNDASTVDETAKLCRKLGFPVYVVGVPAPFGMAKVQMKYVEFDPMYSQGEQWVEIEQGPETLYPEVVRVRSGRLADDAIDSGFGPYALSRLCAETGGIYFRVHANSGARGRVTNEDTAPLSSRLRYFFDPEVMRHYQPDYASPEKVAKEINANSAKRALFTAAGM
ncbi:MAG: vWA domain-containing protein [Planctomycetia bacterium]